MNKILQIHPSDNVVVAIFPLAEGDYIVFHKNKFIIKDPVNAGQKVAIQDIQEGKMVIKYGFPIGRARKHISTGERVDENNIITNLSGIQDYSWNPNISQNRIPNKKLKFLGYQRKNGKVGIRNEIWIIPTVGCVNGIVNELAHSLHSETQCKGVDAIAAFPHNYGCSQLGEDHENTRKILRNMVMHPNVGGILIVGLGCENNQPDAFKELLGEYEQERVRFMTTQTVEDEYETGMNILRELYDIVSTDERTEIPLNELCVGLKCGGSDGFSGITANPLLGRFSDYLIAQGGTTVLTEVPEMFGAESLLMNRCETRELFEKTVHLINDFKNYFISHNQPIYENPSPGNKAGGISTLEEKSLGCTQKSGSSPVKDVLTYGEILKTKGLNLLSAPGNDLVASTALAASGCQMVLFTTGRGTPFGTFVPTIKISTQTTLYNHKPNWIDFNAGSILEGKSMEDVCNEFIEFIIETASGKYTNNEKKNYREIAILKSGVTL